jgi:hypothetical protein
VHTVTAWLERVKGIKKEGRTKVFENRVLGRILSPHMGGVTGG